MDEVGTHVPVMRDEAVAALDVRATGTYLDGTFGRGGHAREVLARLGGEGRLLVMDKDPQAIGVAQALAAADPRVAVRHDSFARMQAWDAVGQGLDGVLLDLGVSSPQIDQAARGFSFQADGPLDMRMDTTRVKAPRSGWPVPASARSPTRCGSSARSGTVGASRARWWRNGPRVRSPPPASWPSW